MGGMKSVEALGSESMGRLLLRLSTPSIVGMMVQSLYNVVDALFVGRGVGPHGIAAVFVAFPLQVAVMAVALMLGFGGVSVISRSLGAQDMERAEKALGTVTSVSFLWGICVAVSNTVFAVPIVRFLGASNEIAHLSAEYVAIIALGAPLFCYSIVSNNSARSEGNARLAMYTMIISGLMNCVLDPLFIFVFGWGVAGAAWATVISQAFGALWLAHYYWQGKSAVRLRRDCLIPDPLLLWDVVKVGFSAFVRQIGMAFTITVLNNVFSRYGGDIGVAAYGIIQRTNSMIIMPILGMVQGMLPIVGYNWGAGKYDRVNEAFRLSVIAGTLICALGACVLLLFPEYVFGIFSHDARLIAGGVLGARTIGLGMTLVAFQIIVSGFYQGLGRGVPALCFSVMRQIALITPLIYLLSHFWGIKGAWWAFPITDVVAFAVTFGYFVWDRKRDFGRKSPSAFD